MSWVARGALPDLNRAFAALPRSMRDTSVHTLMQDGLSYMPKVHIDTYEVAIDASSSMGGIASTTKEKPARRSVRFEGATWNSADLNLQSDIMLKELFVVLIAVKLSPRDCNLRVWVDSAVNVFAFSKGSPSRTDSPFKTLTAQIRRTIAEKNISLMMRSVHPSENPAVLPSRELMNPIPLDAGSHFGNQ
jgi:hypothetical protein